MFLFLPKNTLSGNSNLLSVPAKTSHSFYLPKCLFIWLLLLVEIVTVNAATFTSIQSGNWSNPATWGSAVPGATDAVIIDGGYTVTVDVPGATCSSVQLGVSKMGTGTLTFASSSSQLIVSGNFTLGVNGAGNGANDIVGSLIMTNGGTLKIGGSLTAGKLGTWTPGTGTIEYNGANQTIYSNIYNNLTLSGGGTDILQSGTTTINGNLTVDNTSTTAVIPLTIGGDVILNRGFSFTSGAFTHNVAGNWTNSGWGTFTSTGGTINFTGNSAAINGTNGTQTFNNITISKTAGQTLSVDGSVTTLNITGNLALSSGAFAPGTASTLISGNWTNTGGVVTAGTGAITFNGSGKTIGGTSSTTFNNLTINNNASGISLGIDQFVNGTLTLNNGILKLGAYNLTLGASSPAVAGSFYNSSLIIADGTGQVRKVFNGNGSYTFPIGDSAPFYSPITLNFASGTYSVGAYAGVKVTNAKHPQNSSPVNYLTRYWSVNQSGISAFSCTVTASYPNSYGDDVVGQENLSTVVEYTGSLPWISYPATLSSSTLIATGVSVFGDFTGMGVPVVNTSVTSLDGFTYIHYYGPSDPPKTFNVNALNLSSNLIITAPADFVISTDYTNGYTNSISITPSNGSVSTTIYVRLKAGLPVGNYSNENIVCTSNGFSPLNVLLTNATVTAPGACTPTGDNSAYSITLVKFGSINNVTAKPSGYTDYTSTQSTDLVVGNTYQLTVNVNTNGSNQVGAKAWIDWNNGGFTYNSGYQAYDLGVTTNTSNGKTANCPLSITVPAGASLGKIRMRVACLFYNSPYNVCDNNSEVEDYTLNIVSPTITTTATLTGFSYSLGTGPSAQQSFTVGGTYLTSPIVVTPPADYEISLTSGGAFVATNPITLTPTSGTVTSTTLYARLKSGLPVGTYPNENITFTSTGAATKNVVCSGTVINNYSSITTGIVSGSPFCAGSVISVPYAISGTYTSGNVFTAQLSDATGSFLSPVTIGTLPSTAAGTISAVIPLATPSGASYRIRVVSSTPAITGTDNGINLTIIPATTIITQSTDAQTQCAGGTFTPITVTASGAGLNYQWYSNTTASTSGGTSLGATNGAQTSIYTPQSTTAGTLFYYCVVSGTCTTATSAVSGAFSVNPILPVSVVIAPSLNPVYESNSVTFTATPTNGGTAPVYQWKVNGTIVGTNTPSYTYTPVNGDLVTCMLSSNASPCAIGSPASSNTVTMTVNLNKWSGNVSTDWATGTNWAAGTPPADGANVVFADTPTYDLVLDGNRTIANLTNTSSKRLFIPAGKSLKITGTINTNNDPAKIYIQSSSTLPNGTLIFTTTSPVYGTVEMYSKAFCNNPSTKTDFKWQYFGIPVLPMIATPTFDGSYVRSWDETAPQATHWVPLNNLSPLNPFIGYEITQLTARTIVFAGQLVNSDFNSGVLAISPAPAAFPGQHIFANPYTAAINIKNLNFGSDAEHTVYMYNTGSMTDWNTYNGTYSSTSTTPGQYTAIPQATAGNMMQLDVPSMQAMLIRPNPLSSTFDNFTFGISYNSVFMNNATQQRVAADKTQSATDSITGTFIELKGTTFSDRMWLFTQPGCSRTFDNGWDGAKILGEALSPQIYAIEPDNNYQVDAVEDMNNTFLGFQAGADTEYTLTFTHQNLASKYAGVFLVDLVENKTIDITESGSTYSFVAESTPSPVKRFMIATRNIEKDAPDAETQLKVFSSGRTLFVQNQSSQHGELVIYDMLGRYLKKVQVAPNGITAVQAGMMAGTYLTKASTSTESVSKSIMIGK